MTAPDVDQELERLLTATREGTAPDAEARTRIRAALALGLVSGGVSPLNAVVHTGRGAKLWLLSTFGVAIVMGVGLMLSSPAAAPPPVVRKAAPLAVVSEAVPPDAPAVSAQVSPAFSASASLEPVPSAPVKARATKAEDPAAELALVSSMQLALRSGNASQALALANEHARRFPSGALVQEREGARAIARCQLAPPAGRGAILGAFEQRYASSPYAARVRAACAP